MLHILTDYHSIEEFLRSKKNTDFEGIRLLYSHVNHRIKKIVELCGDLGVETQIVDKQVLEKKLAEKEGSSSYNKDDKKGFRGVALIIDSGESLIKRASLESFFAKIKDKKEASLFVLDGISDCNNMGSIIRSGGQFGIDGIVVPRHNSARGDETILKTSAGLACHVDIIEVPNINKAIEKMKMEGFWIFASDVEGESLYNVKFPEKVAVVMGSEGGGISRLVKKNCDCVISIPTTRKIDSLNVSVATGIVMYELKRHMNLSITDLHNKNY